MRKHTRLEQQYHREGGRTVPRQARTGREEGRKEPKEYKRDIKISQMRTPPINRRLQRPGDMAKLASGRITQSWLDRH